MCGTLFLVTLYVIPLGSFLILVKFLLSTCLDWKFNREKSWKNVNVCLLHTMLAARGKKLFCITTSEVRDNGFTTVFRFIGRHLLLIWWSAVGNPNRTVILDIFSVFFSMWNCGIFNSLLYVHLRNTIFYYVIVLMNILYSSVES